MICGQDNFAGEKVFESFRLLMIWGQAILQAKKTLDVSRLLMICGQAILQAKKTLNISRLLMICGQDNSAGEKVFHYFRGNDDLRLRQIWKRKSLWMFSGFWSFAAKTILHAKKILEYFQVLDDLRLRQFCRWKILRIFSGFGWSAAKTNLQAKKTLINFGILMICGQDNFAGEKDFEYFQVIDDLRLRQFCRSKSLWICSRFWWSAAKTNLQAKKSLNVFGILMICGQDNFAGEKVFQCFHFVDDLRLRQFCRWKSLWIFPGFRWSAAKTFLQAKTSLNVPGTLMICG